MGDPIAEIPQPPVRDVRKSAFGAEWRLQRKTLIVLFRLFLIAIVGALTACGTSAPTITGTASPDSNASSSGATPLTNADGLAALCVQTINDFRATIAMPPLNHWTEGEACTSTEAEGDAAANQAHAHFGACGEWAQNECPNWPGPPETHIVSCLTMMWNEGPGDNFALHGHYLNMTNPAYTKVACGFFVTAEGRFWAIQNFR